MLLANPYKIIAAREAKVQVEKDKIKAREKALKKAEKNKKYHWQFLF
jgi:YidC/Oxa1 family membrane protein insertase